MPSSPQAALRRRLTVLQLVPGLDTGGAERTTIDIAAALVARGGRALVASQGGRLETELGEAGGELIRMNVQTKNPAALLANALRLARLIQRERVDILHARSRAPAWSGLLAARLAGVPFVTTYHGIYAEKGRLKRLYNSVMARGDAVIANSHYTAALIRARYGTPPQRLTVIQRGTDLARFDPEAVGPERLAALRQAWGLSGGETLVLNLARLTGWKGQEVLIEAAGLSPLAGRQDLVVILAGDDQGREGYRGELQRAIARRGLAGRVRIVGHCADVPAALALADVAVVASTEPEAFGRAAVEAEAMGVPVVVTALGAVPETVLAPPAVPPAERTGWHVPPGDAPALAAALGEALDLVPAERAALSIRARRQAERLSLPAMQEATLALYDRVAAAAAERP
jgi:glycosyltransferase involved in cell wall biosynthesis